jgi:hypothetical protein
VYNFETQELWLLLTGGRCSEVADVAKIETGLDATGRYLLRGCHSIRFDCTSKIGKNRPFSAGKDRICQ